MAKSGKGYLNLGLIWLINVILAIIPVTSCLFGGLTRIMRGHCFMRLLQLLFLVEVVSSFLALVTVLLSVDLPVFP